MTEVLVFGGSGFAGRATVRRLVEAGCAVTMANRGKTHWGDSNPLRVPVLICNRQDPSSVVAALKARPWKAIVDFTCFGPSDVKPILDHFESENGGQMPYLCFISTDNVYNMSAFRNQPEQSEDMAHFVDDLELRRQLEGEDEYGAGKLQVEEMLVEKNAWCLRLPDVYGPFDEMRFWKYFLWLSVADKFPVFVQNNRELSFVYSEDVAKCICIAITQCVPTERPRGATNVGDARRLTLKDFLLLYAKCAGFKHEIKFCNDPKSDVWPEEFLPSVDYAIKVEKLLRQLPQFNPTPMEEGLSQMSSFYRRAYDKYPKEREEVISEFPKQFHSLIRRRAIELADE